MLRLVSGVFLSFPQLKLNSYPVSRREQPTSAPPRSSLIVPAIKCVFVLIVSQQLMADVGRAESRSEKLTYCRHGKRVVQSFRYANV